MKNFLVLVICAIGLYYVFTKGAETSQTTVFSPNITNNVDFCAASSEIRKIKVYYNETDFIMQEITVNISGMQGGSEKRCLVDITRRALGSQRPSDKNAALFSTTLLKCDLDEYARRDLAKNMQNLQKSTLQESPYILENTNNDCKFYILENNNWVKYPPDDKKKVIGE